jgi:hypothetical protein
MKLCSSCQQLDLQFLSGIHYQWRNFLARSVLVAANQGCSFCGLLVQWLGPNAREIMRSNNTSWVRIFFERRSSDKITGQGLGIRWMHVMITSAATPGMTWKDGMKADFHVVADDGELQLLLFLLNRLKRWD